MTLYEGTSERGLYLASVNGEHAPASTPGERAGQRGPRRLQRRRLAILYADVAGYSRLMCEDEDSAHGLLDRHLDVLGAHVLANGGTICHYAGDAILACFTSASQALRCAVEAQQDLTRRNRRIRNERRLQFRIGLNIADVILARGEIFGVGVNITARLQALAAPGGVCLSDDLRVCLTETVGNDLVDLGDCWLKNITEPVRAWRFQMHRKPSATGRPRRHAALAAALHALSSQPPVMTQRESGAEGRLPEAGINALRNLEVLRDGADSEAIRAELGRRDIGAPPRRSTPADAGRIRVPSARSRDEGARPGATPP